jgi:hypothetical protein
MPTNNTRRSFRRCVATITVLISLAAVVVAAPPKPVAPISVSGSFFGHIVTYGINTTYTLYNNLEQEKHIDFMGPVMMGAFVNGAGYLNGDAGCQAFPNENFPFYRNSMADGNATFIGYEILLDISPQVIMQHWAVRFSTMGSEWYVSESVSVLQ